MYDGRQPISIVGRTFLNKSSEGMTRGYTKKGQLELMPHSLVIPWLKTPVRSCAVTCDLDIVLLDERLKPASSNFKFKVDVDLNLSDTTIVFGRDFAAKHIQRIDRSSLRLYLNPTNGERRVPVNCTEYLPGMNAEIAYDFLCLDEGKSESNEIPLRLFCHINLHSNAATRQRSKQGGR